MKKISLFLITILMLTVSILAQVADSVRVSVTVQGTVFALGLQDSNGAPWSGDMNFGDVRPGESAYPPSALVVAACKSNTGRQWYLKVNSSSLKEPKAGYVLSPSLLSVYVGDPAERRQPALPGKRYAPGELPLKFTNDELTVYSSNALGDGGFAGGWGTFVPVGFGLTIPDTQREGTYSGIIRFTMTE
ncbi:MAG: hypothetical protein WC838_00555 [Candidatus Margulisiibacteriota bacterium]|jgi:hypothetical protein